MTDPYSVLGITPGADDETIKKAYRQKCKQYHPDLHPDDPSAEEHFKEVQAAYSEIMRIKQGGGTTYRQSSQSYGQSGYGQQYQDPFSGGGFGFGPFGFGYYSTSGSTGGQSYGSTAGDPELRAAANYIRSGFYEEAMNTLNGIPTANRHGAVALLRRAGQPGAWQQYPCPGGSPHGGIDGAEQLRLSELGWTSCKARAAATRATSSPTPSPAAARIVLFVVLAVFAGMQCAELVLLRRQRRILYLLILDRKGAVAGVVTAPFVIVRQGRTYAARNREARRRLWES